MKKILSLLTLALFSVVSFAASITCADIDFGTVSIKGETLPKQGSTTVTVTFAGLAQYYSIYAYITEGLLDDATNPNGFTASPYNQTIKTENGTCEVTVNYSVKAAGTYTGKLEFWCYDKDYNDVYGHANVSITVTDEAIVAKTIPFERVEKTADLKDGDTIVFVCESQGAVCGPLAMPALTSVTENVTINTTTHKAEVPEATAQFFKANKYSDGWQFVTADAAKKGLHLDIEYNSGKGAFTYDAAVAGKILATWGVDISNGVAEVTRNSDGTYPVRWASSSAGGRFKPYKSGDGSTIAIYKKAGKAQELQSSLTIDPTTINLGDVACSATKEVVINYTAAYLEDDIVWAIQGTDYDAFDLIEDTYNTRTSGKLTIKYKGNSTKTGALSAELAYLTKNAQKDDMEGAFPISINLIKLNGISFDATTYNALTQEEVNLSTKVVFDPTDVSNKGLTWKFEKTQYFATLSDAGVFKATATGEYVVIATSVLDENIQAKCTVKVTLPVPQSVELDATELTLHLNETKTLAATIKPTGTEKKPQFESSNTSIATVSSKGVIKGVAYGEVTITVWAEDYPDVKNTCKVTVEKWKVEGITLPSDANLTLGSTLQLNPTITPTEAAAEYTTTYESKNESVAMVSESGLVTSKAEGDAVIVATIDGKEAQITIHVVAANTFAKVTDASTLAAKDTIILATIYNSTPIVAGARDGKQLTLAKNGVSVNATEAYADDACRLVLGTEKNKTGFTLTPVGSSKSIAAKTDDTGLIDGTATNNHMWQFTADANGVYAQNTVVTAAVFKYFEDNKNIKFYKAGTAVPVYVYVRKYVNPNPPTGMEEAQGDVQSTKVLRNGQIVILRGDKAYTITGQEIR